MGKDVKRSFIFNIDWRDVLMDYPAEVRYEVYDAIIEYAASGKLTELKPLAKMAFSFIKKEMDYNNERYNDIVAKRSEAGKKGMASRYSLQKDDGELTKLTSDNKTNKSYQTVTNVTSDNKTNYNEYDNDNDKEIVSTDVETVKKGTDVPKEDAATAATLSRKEKFGKSLIPYVEKYGKDMVRDFFDYWTEMNQSKSKMRFEQQPTWETSKRLATWAKRDKNYADNTKGHEDRRRGYDVAATGEKDYNSSF